MTIENNIFVENSTLLLEKIWQQIYLAGSATLLAILLGIPLGIWIVRHPRLKEILLATTGILQTIPSLALLALLLPFLGIGIKPALVALALYALLPIVRNTVTGITTIAPILIEAADSLGFTARQKLWLVELPLAMPMIMAGIRTATAMSVGIATLAAFIGAGGLGDFIYQGLSLNNIPLVLLGAIPAALLALFLDFILSRIEKSLTMRCWPSFPNKQWTYVSMGGLILICSLLVGIFLLASGHKNAEQTLTIGSKDFTEQYLLGELMAQVIENKTDLKVIRKFNLGGTLFCHQALVKGSIDLYPEYTGTAYTVILHQEAQTNGIYEKVKTLYLQKFKLHWLLPFGFNNTQALAVPTSLAKKYHLKTLTDLVPLARQLTIGVPGDFYQRPDGFIGLKKNYHLQFKKIKLMDPNLMYAAIKNQQVDIIMAFSTDARIVENQLTLLEDDKHIFPPYYAAPILREEIISKHPEVSAALQVLAQLIDEKTMQRLNYAVDIDKQSPYFVAKQFLQSHHILQ